MRDFGGMPRLLKRPLRGARRRGAFRRRLILAAACAAVLLLLVVLLTGRSSDPPPMHEDLMMGEGSPLLTPATEAVRWKAITTGHACNSAWMVLKPAVTVSLRCNADSALITPTIVSRHRRGKHTQWEMLYQPNDTYRMPAWATADDHATVEHASIFTSLAAFRDYECATTVRDLYAQSLAPHRLYVGISEERTPSDASCLAYLGVFGAQGFSNAAAIRVLYGTDAPADLRVELRPLSWAEVVAPRAVIDVDAVMNGSVLVSTSSQPEGIFLHPAHAEERLSCVAGELETLRDRLLLAEDARLREAGERTVFRRGVGGPQQQPSPALAGCRVTTRVTSPDLARGPTFGRYITSLFFFNQDYYMVVDSHTRFAVHWDAKLITRILQLPTLGVLSYYPNAYKEGAPGEEYSQQSVMQMCWAQVIANGMPKLGARWMPVSKHPITQGFAAAGFIFGDAQYVLDTPFDPFLPYLFDGEEVLYSARMWTAGWDIYGPGESNVFHHYVRLNTPKYFGIMSAPQAARKVLAERRTLYLLRRAQPWIQELVTRGYVTADGQKTLKPLPPAEDPETRLIVTDEAAAASLPLSVWKSYYGMGEVRTLAQYWDHTQLSDSFIKKKDNENRWMGGEGLCDAAKKELGV